VLRAAGRIATVRRASLIVAYVSPDPALLLVDSGVMPHYLSHEDMAPAFFPMVVESLFDLDVRWELATLVGDAAIELAQVARMRSVRAAIVGKRSLGRWLRLRRILGGSVSQRLGQLQPAPVITVPRAD